VVPGTSLTIIRSSRSNRLTSDDLPALGRPTMAMPTSPAKGAGPGGTADSAAGSAHRILDDRSVLLSDDNVPDKDTYTVKFASSIAKATAIRLQGRS